MKNDSSDFTDLGNQVLSIDRLCKNDPNKPIDGFTMKAEAKGYTIEKTDKKRQTDL